jgi:hypothetical protein
MGGCDILERGKKNIIPFGTIVPGAGSNASLVSFEAVGHSISPAFEAETTGYTLIVSKPATPTLTVRAIGPEGAAVTAGINDLTPEAVPETDYCATFTLDGSRDVNVITVSVTSEDGSATMAYTLRVYYEGTSASPSSLAVSLTSGSLGDVTESLTPTFDAGVTDYTVGISYAVTSVDVTLTLPEGSGMTAMVDGWTALSGVAVPITSLPAAGGSSTVTVAVTSQDESVTNTYTITIVKGAAPSTESRLKSLAFKYKWGGLWYNEDLSPDPTSAKLLTCFDYAANFSILITSTFRLTVEPLENSITSIEGRVSVDGGPETSFNFSESSGVYTGELSGGGDSSVTEAFIDVTAEDGTTVTTYKVTITVE